DGVDRVATLLEDAASGLDLKRVAGRDHASMRSAGRHDDRTSMRVGPGLSSAALTRSPSPLTVVSRSAEQPNPVAIWTRSWACASVADTGIPAFFMASRISP